MLESQSLAVPELVTKLSGSWGACAVHTTASGEIGSLSTPSVLERKILQDLGRLMLNGSLATCQVEVTNHEETKG